MAIYIGLILNESKCYGGDNISNRLISSVNSYDIQPWPTPNQRPLGEGPEIQFILQ